MSNVEFTLNGRTLSAQQGETILAAAQRHGMAIPHLCCQDGMQPAGNCRACVVEIEGERSLAPSCCRQPTPGMTVRADSQRAQHAQKLVLELLGAGRKDLREQNQASELAHWCEQLGVTESRFPSAVDRIEPDRSHPAIAVNLDACILCTRCLRACRDEQANDVIGLAGRGAHARIVFDCDALLGNSSCVACGECVQACPTGALMPARYKSEDIPEEQVVSICPYCGVGCQLTYHVSDNTIRYVTGHDGPANSGRLCVKGRYGFDYVHHPQRLQVPLVRREDVPKQDSERIDPANPWTHFRVATWEEALDLAANGLRRVLAQHGRESLAGFGSAKCSNEEAYLFQKLVRTGFGNNNVDHCTRLCHASSVAALLEGIGSGAVSNPVRDVDQAELIFVIGANPGANHPVAASFIKNAAQRGAKLVVADPRRIDLMRHATWSLQFNPDTDVALLNAMLHTIIEEDLCDPAFIAARTSGFPELAEKVRAYAPEAMAPICGIPAATIREVARAYARAKASMIFWGMGISQHIHGTDNVRCLISLCLATGQIGRPGCGLHPLRGQNNVQGASDAGLIPMMYPDYQRVDNPAVRRKFEEFWGMPLASQPGLTVVETLDAVHAGVIHGMYILGENPAMSDPDLNHARAALAMLDWLVVQDIFLTETAMLADVILPAAAFAEKNGSVTNTDRLVQRVRPALVPPGQARADWWIIQEIARRLGLPWQYADIAEVYEEMRQTMSSIKGISWRRLDRERAVTYPCSDEHEPGQSVVFTERFPTADERACFKPVDLQSAAELPDAEYPFVLITGRQLEHWHTGAMTRRSRVLDAIEPSATVSVHPLDLAAFGRKPGQMLRLTSRRGSLALAARADEAIPRGAVFVAFAYHEAAANLLTNPQLDPAGKIPEFKFCAVKVEAG
ncbi:MAG: formate dehydrogenase subunit alpha [Betaproteobacteria bacterium]|nr:formate dehydrogenase subunit alpha [Betaproteobacteria bacterium]